MTLGPHYPTQRVRFKVLGHYFFGHLSRLKSLANCLPAVQETCISLNSATFSLLSNKMEDTYEHRKLAVSPEKKNRLVILNPLQSLLSLHYSTCPKNRLVYLQSRRTHLKLDSQSRFIIELSPFEEMQIVEEWFPFSYRIRPLFGS